MESALMKIDSKVIQVWRVGTDLYTDQPVTQTELDKIIAELDRLGFTS
jgi:hypothetical protein